jgi:hypothetical protein
MFSFSFAKSSEPGEGRSETLIAHHLTNTERGEFLEGGALMSPCLLMRIRKRGFQTVAAHETLKWWEGTP